VRQSLIDLRVQMEKAGLDVWIEPTADPHQSEYLPLHWKTRHWLTGFSGSAGVAVVTKHKAGMWTDSRYWIQAAGELADSGFELFKSGAPGVPGWQDWLAAEVPAEAVVGFNGAIMACSQYWGLQEKLPHAEFRYTEDLIDRIWSDRPPMPQNPLHLFAVEYAGEGRDSKIKRVQAELERTNTQACLVSALDDVAWLFNVRGEDVAFNPVGYAWGIITREEAWLFVDAAKLDDAAVAEFTADGVRLAAYDQVGAFLAALPEDTRLLMDSSRTNMLLADGVPDHCDIVYELSTVASLKTVKNAVEAEGIRRAHERDGAALVRFFHWLQGHVGSEPLDEHTAAEKLETFRAQGNLYKGQSFYPIIAYQANGAQIHYAAGPGKAAAISAAGMLLIDTGGQYLDGTTDVTRTLALGQPTADQVRHYTLVLKAHVQLAMCLFPQGTNGCQIDAVCRAPLWRQGLNYGHGTGHGVGHYLNVHEGPQSFSTRSTRVAFTPGMLTSNEPGLYFEGRYGIRIESLVLCEEKMHTDDGVFLGFETVTMCPFDRNLIDAALLNPDEREWVNDYHRRVRETLLPLLDEAAADWLRSATLPL